MQVQAIQTGSSGNKFRTCGGLPGHLDDASGQDIERQCLSGPRLTGFRHFERDTAAMAGCMAGPRSDRQYGMSTGNRPDMRDFGTNGALRRDSLRLL